MRRRNHAYRHSNLFPQTSRSSRPGVQWQSWENQTYEQMAQSRFLHAVKSQLTTILTDWIKFLSHQQETRLPETVDEQLRLVLQYLQSERCLLILDNMETVLRGGERAGQYCQGYEERQVSGLSPRLLEGVNIIGATGLTAAQKAVLKVNGAVEGET